MYKICVHPVWQGEKRLANKLRLRFLKINCPVDSPCFFFDSTQLCRMDVVLNLSTQQAKQTSTFHQLVYVCASMRPVGIPSPTIMQMFFLWT